MTSQLANCSKDVADKTRCTKVIADAKLLKAIGTDMAADDVYNKKTTAEQAKWWTAYAKKQVAKADVALAASTVGESCKAAAVVAPATKGVRPGCNERQDGSELCCMGLKAKKTDTTNYTETCQRKTDTVSKVFTKRDEFVAKSGFVW